MVKKNNGAPIKKTLKTCKKVENGNLEARISNITGEGEAGELMRTINRLIDRMDANIRKPGVYPDEPEACSGDARENKGYCGKAVKDISGGFSETDGPAGRVLAASADSAEQGEEIRARIGTLRTEINSFLSGIRKVH